jgi:hypothetical protein
VTNSQRVAWVERRRALFGHNRINHVRRQHNQKYPSEGSKELSCCMNVYARRDFGDHQL